MALTKVQQSIWAKAIMKELKTITSLRNHCDFQYEKDSKNAKEVHISSITRPTIRTYVPGTAITLEALTDAQQTLKLDQFKYFNFEMEDIDKAQSIPGVMEDASRQASLGLAEEGDKYVASIVDAALTAGDIDSVATVTLSKTNAMEQFEKGFVKLYEKNVPVNEPLYMEVAPAVFSMLRQNLTELSTDNPEILKKGAVGKINNAYVCIENLLGKTSANDYENILRTGHAIAFAEQIDKVEAYRPQNAFQDALKGLYVFGAKIVRPDEIVVVKTK